MSFVSVTPAWLPPLTRGFGLGGSLIVAIGAQNAYVLKQGLRREHVFALATVCFLSDATLITVGAGGFGALVQSNPLFVRIATWVGALFLLGYGLRSARAALHSGAMEVDAGVPATSLRTALLTCLAVTWLNPHVYLDTVLLVGGIAGQYALAERLWFAAGAMSASCIWFYGLGYGAALLAPLFRKPMTWRVLDALIAAVMWTIAMLLLLGKPA
jgi:L-lysine exporter family protein LysE/ArgO